MANKRETKRERREEAKRRRLEELRRRQRKDRIRKIGIGGVVVAAIVAVILLFTLLGGGGGELDPVAVRAAGCTPVASPPNEGSTHVQPPLTVNYKTIPPTSGNHYGSTAQTGVYNEPVQNEFQVHNLEHGHIVFQFQPGVDPAILDGIAQIVKDNRTSAILAPNPNMPFQLAFTGWGKLLGCSAPSEKSVALAREFFNTFRNKGPERIPGNPRPADAPLPTGSPTGSPTSAPGTSSPSPTPTST